MICPKCQHDMIVVEHRQIELDYCTGCEGVWFDGGELELLIRTAELESPDLSLSSLLASPAAQASHRGRKCPICGRRMQEVAIGEPPINIDVCTQGDGFWFDGGEVQQLLEQLAEQSVAEGGAPRQVFSFLGEAFQAKKAK